MNIEDMFKVVKARFTDDNHQSVQMEKDVEIPQDLLFKCPRCSSVLYND